MTAFTVGEKDIVMHLDTSGGFTDFYPITFAASGILKQAGSIGGVLGFMRRIFFLLATALGGFLFV